MIAVRTCRRWKTKLRFLRTFPIIRSRWDSRSKVENLAGWLMIRSQEGYRSNPRKHIATRHWNHYPLEETVIKKDTMIISIYSVPRLNIIRLNPTERFHSLVWFFFDICRYYYIFQEDQYIKLFNLLYFCLGFSLLTC